MNDEQIMEALAAVQADLEHYVSTYGPGPDVRRLADYVSALAEVRFRLHIATARELRDRAGRAPTIERREDVRGYPGVSWLLTHADGSAQVCETRAEAERELRDR